MVEGHSVHRVAAGHRKRLVGQTFAATSPNGRFTEGAQLIDGKKFASIEAVGKNLFAFFGGVGPSEEEEEEEEVVVHVHFGMAGNWAVFDLATEDEPAPTATTRLRLAAGPLVAHLSAMTVNHGDRAGLYEAKRRTLGEDPLRADADVERLWVKVKKAKKSIGALVMDQSCFCGPGNIYRAEILFKAAVHPDVPGSQVTRAEFNEIWHHTVALMRRGFESGSILTVDDADRAAWGIAPHLRRYVYNAAKCPKCRMAVKSWDIANRTAYACPSCQPPPSQREKKAEVDVQPFRSHCVREARDTLKAQKLLTIAELRDELKSRGLPTTGKKDDLQARLDQADVVLLVENPVSASDAADEKIRAGESRAVEHVADIAPSQARARVRKLAASTAVVTPPRPAKKLRRAAAAK